MQTVDLKLDPASMWRVDGARPGDIRVVLRDSAGAVLAKAAKEVTILAANQWKATPPQLALEILAAYIQPNAAAIAPGAQGLSRRPTSTADPRRTPA